MRKYSSNLAFVDLLFNLLVGFTSLLILAFLLINPVADNGQVDPPVMMLVEMRWDDESSDDVDLWIKGPDAIVGFSRKESGYMTLERDDLGTANDVMTVNGETTVIKRNYEMVSFTALPDGEYVINVHMFNANFRGEPEAVEIKVSLVGPYHMVWAGTVHLVVAKQELTAVSFVVKDGVVTDLYTDIQIPVRARTIHP